MYPCKQCGTGNPLDSSFCKKCGTALPENELAEARVKLNEMLEEGNNLFTDGRTDEAMLIAEAAVTANPSSHLAHSLKGLCHERMGQIAEALECYEAAVGLNPDSSLDKVKVAALRNRLAQRVADLPEPNRKGAVMMAGAAMVLCLVVGGFAAIGMNRHESPKVAANPPTDQQKTAAEFVNQQTPQSPSGTTPPPTNQVTPPQVIPPNNPGGNYVYPGSVLPGIPSGDNLPGVTGTSTNVGEIGPLQVVGTIGNTPGNSGVSTPKSIDPNPNVVEKHNDPVEPTKPPDDEGYINIQRAPTRPKTPGGSEDASPNDGHDTATVLQAGQQLYMLHHYDQAASKFAKVAEMGGNSGKLQQRLGDCYRNLDKPDLARAAYNRAINMFQAQIKQGRDVAGNQRGLDTCESALKVLGG